MLSSRAGLCVCVLATVRGLPSCVGCHHIRCVMPTTRSKKASGDTDDVGASRPESKPIKKLAREKAQTGPDSDAGAAAQRTEAATVVDQPLKPGTKRKQPDVARTEGGAGSTDEEGGQGDKGSLPDNAVEQGSVSFLFKPKVTTPGADVEVPSLDDVARLYILLEPEQPAGGKCRLLVVAKKRLPDTKKHERFFAFVEAVGSSPSELTQGLQEHTYTTKTRGERLQPAARPAGEGTYIIAKGGSKNSVHLGFKLSQPPEPGDIQDMLGIKGEGSFVLSAKNPDNKGRPGANVPSAGPEPAYSDEQKEEFQGRSCIGVEDRSLLDVTGTELLLVGAKENPIETGELGDAGKLLEEA